MSAAAAARPRPTPPRPRRATAPTRRPRLRVVAAPRHTGRWVLLLVAVAAAGVFGVVSLSALAAEQAFTARELQTEITDLTHRYEELTAEVSALEAPGRVRRVAEEELGMVPAEQPAYLVLEDGEHVVPVSHEGAAAGDEAGPVADPLKQALGASQ